jgi:hypothetical protein
MIFGDEANHEAHCRKCGSLLYSVVREGAFVHVAMGTLVDDPSIRPTAHILLAPRHRGSRSRTTCRNTGSISWRVERLTLLREYSSSPEVYIWTGTRRKR